MHRYHCKRAWLGCNELTVCRSVDKDRGKQSSRSATYLGSEDGGSNTHKRGSESRRWSEEGGYEEPLKCCKSRAGRWSFVGFCLSREQRFIAGRRGANHGAASVPAERHLENFSGPCRHWSFSTTQSDEIEMRMHGTTFSSATVKCRLPYPGVQTSFKREVVTQCEI
jgi:hypothetical protein